MWAKLIMKFEMKFTHCCENAAIKFIYIFKKKKEKKDSALIDMNQYLDQ